MNLDSIPHDKEAAVKWVGEVIHREISKPNGEADMELIADCEECLAELLKNDVSFTNDELEVKARKIIARGKRPYSAPLKMTRRIAALAACLAVVIGFVSACAFIPTLRDFIREALELAVGDSNDVNGVAYVYYGKYTAYSSIDELVAMENLDILIPRHLPDEIHITEIVVDENNISIVLDDSDISILIESSKNIKSEEALVYDETIEIDGRISYIIEIEECFESITMYDNYIYYITTSTKNQNMIILYSLNTIGD